MSKWNALRDFALAKTQRRRVFLDRIDSFLDRINRIDRIMLLIFFTAKTQRKNAKDAKAWFSNNLVASFAKPFATLAVKK